MPSHRFRMLTAKSMDSSDSFPFAIIDTSYCVKSCAPPTVKSTVNAVGEIECSAFGEMKSVLNPAKRDFTALRFHQPQADFTRPQGRISLKNPFCFRKRGFSWSGRRDSNSLPPPWQGGALPNELRPQWCLRPESNWRHADFQSAALPTELPRHMATRNGLEPSTSSVTGWRSKPTELPGRMVGTTGLEPVTPCL